MLNATKVITRSAALTLVVLLPFAAQPAMAGKCASIAIAGTGKGATVNRAMSNAKAKWQQRVEKRFGLLWSRWSWSKKKSRQCKKVRARWTCRVKAIPCSAL